MLKRRRWSTRRYGPGGLPPLTGWSNVSVGADGGEVLGLSYTGVSSGELERVSAAVAGPLEASVRFVGPVAGVLAAVEPARKVETEPFPQLTQASHPGRPGAATPELSGQAPRLRVLVIPGGLGWRSVASSADTLAWLSAAAQQAQGVITVSTGSLLLAATGVLKGDLAAGHWLGAPDLVELGAEAVGDRVVVSRDGRWVTASGGSAAVDAASELAARLLWGSDKT